MSVESSIEGPNLKGPGIAGATSIAPRASSPGKESSGREKLACLHCGQPLAPAQEEFCCRGCEAVYGLLHSEGLGRYYDLRGGEKSSPVQLGSRSHGWLEGLEVSTGRLSLDVQGIHCAACVWLMGRLFERQSGAGQIKVHPGIGRLDLWFDPASFSLAEYVKKIESYGYQLGPARKGERTPSSSLALRMGITAALALNSMLFSFAFYFGLSSADGSVYPFFGAINIVLTTLAVLVGGTYFFRSAWASLRHRAMHLDLPIALGIALSYLGSVYAFVTRGGGAAFFDTVCAFIALMLLGKYLPLRLIERNRARVLQDDGVEQLPQKRAGQDGELQRIGAGEVREGDELVFAPGDLVAVDVVLSRGEAVCSLDWITGEAEPKQFQAGQTVPAGAFNVGSRAFRGRAGHDFASSRIRTLLSAAPAALGQTPRERFLDLFSRFYVAAVLVLATATALYWTVLRSNPDMAVMATVAVLVVTCPCAIGLATPMAYELALSLLRRRGLFLRTSAALDKLPHVEMVALDKTGTLTDGELALENPEALSALADQDAAALRAMVEASNHPHSRCLAVALANRVRGSSVELATEETAGQGVEAIQGEQAWRLGSPEFVGPSSARPCEGAATVLARRRKGAWEPLATFRFRESPRPDAREEILALQAEGYRVQVLSGDTPERAQSVGESLGVPRERCLGGLSPEQKALWLKEHSGERTLMLGDGINDSLAFGEAWCSGTPAIHRPFVPAKADFYYLSPGLFPIRESLRISRRLVRVVRGLMGFALTYNAAVVALAMAGLVSPIVAAIAMPASSVVIVAATSWAMTRLR